MTEGKRELKCALVTKSMQATSWVSRVCQRGNSSRYMCFPLPACSLCICRTFEEATCLNKVTPLAGAPRVLRTDLVYPQNHHCHQAFAIACAKKTAHSDVFDTCEVRVSKRLLLAFERFFRATTLRTALQITFFWARSPYEWTVVPSPPPPPPQDP